MNPLCPSPTATPHLLADVGVVLAEARDKLSVVRVLEHPEHVMVDQHLMVRAMEATQGGGKNDSALLLSGRRLLCGTRPLGGRVANDGGCGAATVWGVTSLSPHIDTRTTEAPTLPSKPAHKLTPAKCRAHSEACLRAPDRC